MTFFIILSLIGVLVGIFMVLFSVSWGGLPAFLTFIIGIFVIIKEILDIFFAKD